MDGTFLPEKWAKIKFENTISENEVYEISTYGRVKSFKVNSKTGELIKLFSVNGYKRLPL